MRLAKARIAPMTDAEMGEEHKEALKDFGPRILNIFRTLVRTPKALTRFNAWGGYVLSRRNDLPTDHPQAQAHGGNRDKNRDRNEAPHPVRARFQPRPRRPRHGLDVRGDGVDPLGVGAEGPPEPGRAGRRQDGTLKEIDRTIGKARGGTISPALAGGA